MCRIQCSNVFKPHVPLSWTRQTWENSILQLAHQLRFSESVCSNAVLETRRPPVIKQRLLIKPLSGSWQEAPARCRSGPLRPSSKHLAAVGSKTKTKYRYLAERSKDTAKLLIVCKAKLLRSSGGKKKGRLKMGLIWGGMEEIAGKLRAEFYHWPSFPLLGLSRSVLFPFLTSSLQKQISLLTPVLCICQGWGMHLSAVISHL